LQSKLFILHKQIKYTVEAAASKGAKKQWSFELFTTVEPAPRRKRDVGGNIPFRSNPGYLVDNRAIEFAMKRPSMHWPGDPRDQPSDKRNKDVVIHSTLMSGIYGSNNNLSALTVRNNLPLQLCARQIHIFCSVCFG
jgi:hypothetical protein